MTILARVDRSLPRRSRRSRRCARRGRGSTDTHFFSCKNENDDYIPYTAVFLRRASAPGNKAPSHEEQISFRGICRRGVNGAMGDRSRGNRFVRAGYAQSAGGTVI
jgi:hypothetical protein